LFYYIVLWTLINLKWRPFRNKMAAKCTHFLREKSYFLLFLWCSLSDLDIYHLSTFQVSCNYLVYFLRSNQLYTCITTFYLQDFNIFDGAIKTTITKLPQHTKCAHFLREKSYFFVISLVFFVRFRPSRYQNAQLKVLYQSLVKINQLPV
jgi:hypothetical protein